MGRSSSWDGGLGSGGGGGSGDVTGPASSTDTAVPVFQGITGKILAESTARIESDDLTLAGNLVKFNRGGSDASAAGSGLNALGTGDLTLAELLFDSSLATRWKAGPSGSLSAVLTAGATQTVQNKTHDNTNSAAFKDTSLTIEDPADATKKLRFDAGNVTAGATRVFGVPDADATLVGADSTQTVTNKLHQDSVFDGGVASSARKIILPKDTKANLDALTQEEALLTYATDEDRLYASNGTVQQKIGTVDGPASSTDNRVVRMNGTTGKEIQESGVTIDDLNNLTGVNDLSVGNDLGVTGDLNVTGNTVLTGNLEVNGTQTTLNTADLSVEDQQIQLNFGGTDASAENSGLEIVGTANAAKGRVLYDSTLGSKWKAGAAGSEKELLDIDTAQTVSTKTFNNTNTANLKDDQFTLEDPADATKKARFDAGGVTAGQTRVVTVPDMDLELVGRTNAQTVTSKVIQQSDIDGGTASDTSRITIPGDTYANLLLLTRKAGTILYATDLAEYFKDNGSTLEPVGSSAGGSGEKNYITNPSAANNLDGWAISGAGTLARHTTAANLPRANTTGTGFAFTSSTDEEYVRYRFALDAVDNNKKLKAFLAYVSATANFRIEVWKNSASDYSGTYTELSLKTDSSGDSYLSAATSEYFTSFDTDDTDDLELRLVHNGTGTDTIYFSDVLNGPGITQQGAAVSEWTSFTLSSYLTNEGTLADTIAFYRRVGSDMQVRFSSTMSSNPTGTMVFTPPVGTLDTSVLNSTSGNRTVLGVIYATDEGVGNYYGDVIYEPATSTTGLIFRFSNGALANATPFSWGAGDDFTAEFTVPISEWSGSGTVNLGAGAQVEYAFNTSTTDADDTTSFGYGPTGVTFGSFSTATRTKRVRFQYPIQSDDILIVELRENATAPWFPAANTIGTSLSATTGIAISYVNSTDVDILFGSAGYAASVRSSAGAWSGIAGTWYWRCRKAKASSPVGFGLAKSGESGLINYYYEDDTTLAACTFRGNLGGANSVGVAIKVTRVGRMVTIDIPSLTTVVPTTSSVALIANTALPTWARPSTDKVFYCQTYNGASWVTSEMGTGLVNSSGVITFYRNLANAAYTNSANAGWYHTQISYTV